MMLFDVPILMWVLFIMVFFAGLAFIPLLAYTIGPSLPGFLTEGISNILWVVSMVGVRRGALVQRETNEYEIQRAEPDLEPKSNWSRWALAPFAITFEKSRQAFRPTGLSEQETEAVEALVGDDNGIATADISRGKTDWYVDVPNDSGKILVPLGEWLAKLRPGGGPEIGTEAWSEELMRSGGDTSAHSGKTMLMGTLIFTVLGMGVGFIVFF